MRLLPWDFDRTLREVQKGDFVYLDPPFSVEARRVFNEYDAATFTCDQIDCLRSWLLYLSKHSIAFLASYADCKEGDLLSKGFRVKRVTVKRSIAGFLESRSKATELLISNV